MLVLMVLKEHINLRGSRVSMISQFRMTNVPHMSFSFWELLLHLARKKFEELKLIRSSHIHNCIHDFECILETLLQRPRSPQMSSYQYLFLPLSIINTNQVPFLNSIN